MKYQIIGKNIDITDSISASVEKKLSRLEKYFSSGQEINCRVVCSVHGPKQRVEATIYMPRFTLRAEVEEEDLYAAIDSAVAKLSDQLRRLKTRAQNSVNKFSIGESIIFDNVETALNASKDDVVVRTKSYYLEAMSLDEAIARMEALGHSFFLYLDADDDLISVVYVRHDGGYGVIEAENPIK